MTRLEKIEWDGGGGLEVLCNEGIYHIIAYAKVIIDGAERFSSVVFADGIKDMAEEVEKCLYRFWDEVKSSKPGSQPGCPARDQVAQHLSITATREGVSSDKVSTEVYRPYARGGTVLPRKLSKPEF